jgi:hydrogenase nickel incorporation protein HypA/HybF
MHEMSIVQSLRDSVAEHLPDDAVLDSVVVQVGSLEHLDEAVMQVAWEASGGPGPCGGAELEIEFVEVKVRCRSCHTEYAPENAAYLVCPNCGTARPEILEGWGVTLKTIEARRAPAAAASEANV